MALIKLEGGREKVWERVCPRRVLFSVVAAECFPSPSFLGREVPVTSLSW